MYFSITLFNAVSADKLTSSARDNNEYITSPNSIIKSSVNSNSVLVVDSNAYPFNILLEYGKTVDENTAVIEELEVLLSSLPDKDRDALVIAIGELMEAAQNGNNVESETPNTSGSGAEGT